MTRDELRAWAEGALALGPEQIPAFWLGVLAVCDGTFWERSCASAGHVAESAFCEGGREALLRLAEPAPAGRIGHGEIVAEGP